MLCLFSAGSAGFLRYTNSHVKHSGARNSYTILRCYLKSECYAQDIAAHYRRREGLKPLSLDLQRIICILTGVFYYFVHPIAIREGRLNNRNTCLCNAIHINSSTNYRYIRQYDHEIDSIPL